jgi:hypothetical protein
MQPVADAGRTCPATYAPSRSVFGHDLAAQQLNLAEGSESRIVRRGTARRVAVSSDDDGVT